MSKGTSKETPEGRVYGLKPLVLWSRILAIPIYLGIFLYPLLTQHQQVPVWLPVLVLALLGFAAYQLPGTIVLTPTAVIQHFWLRKDKAIQYHEVMTVQAIQAGRITRVLGDNRVAITHNTAHSDSEGFRTELARRTGKKTTS